VLAVIAESFLGGRCPECLNKVPIAAGGELKCRACGFAPRG
jgi:hypothetical protein